MQFERASFVSTAAVWAAAVWAAAIWCAAMSTAQALTWANLPSLAHCFACRFARRPAHCLVNRLANRPSNRPAYCPANRLAWRLVGWARGAGAACPWRLAVGRGAWVADLNLAGSGAVCPGAVCSGAACSGTMCSGVSANCSLVGCGTTSITSIAIFQVL